MLRVKIYVHWAYLIEHISGLLSYRCGFELESIDLKAYTITGRISREKVAKVWETNGLIIMMDL